MQNSFLKKIESIEKITKHNNEVLFEIEQLTDILVEENDKYRMALENILNAHSVERMVSIAKKALEAI